MLEHSVYVCFSGHRAHSVFVGVHIPTERRHSHKHKKHHHRNSAVDNKSTSEDERPSEYFFYTFTLPFFNESCLKIDTK